MDLAHGWSRQDGHLAEVIAGIPYFYRRFGYEYAVPFPRVWLLADDPPPTGGWTVRPAGVDDAAVIVELQAEAVDGVPLACTGGDLAWWQRRLGSTLEPAWFVAERDGVVGAVASIGHGPPGVGDVALLGAPAFRDGHALSALAAEATTSTGRRPAVQQRRHVDALVAPTATLHPRQYSLYVRVGDPVALLDGLRPALSARLRSSGRSDDEGELLVSFYTSSVLITYAAGEVTSVEARPGEQDPVGKDGIGVPPDLVATLLFGKHGAAGLAERHEDVGLGPRADLAEVLFPRLESDLTLL